MNRKFKSILPIALLIAMLMLTLAAVAPVGTHAQNVDLVITGVVDGPLSGGVPKAVEFYARANISDLSIYGFGSANNGGGTDGQEFTFPSVAATAGDYIYVASESTGFNTFFGFAPNYTNSAASINGDDAIELFQNGVVVDIFGDINVDGSGQPWDYEDGWAYRKDATGPDGNTFILANWDFSGKNALDGETSNATAATPFPIGTYSAVVPDVPPTVSSTDPSDGAEYVLVDAGIVIEFSEDVSVTDPWFEFSCEGSSIPATVSGGPAIYTLSPASDLPKLASCTVTVFASQVADLDDPIENMEEDYVFNFMTNGDCGDPFIPIYGIQGDGWSSPFDGDMVVSEGIVTVDLQKSSQLSGFFIQDRKGDGDPATSDGLFVNHTDYWSPSFNPSVGDLVRVLGTIDEQYGQTQMEWLEWAAICDTGFQLNPTNVFARDFNANAESYEGMYVRFPRQMFVTDTYNQHRFGEIWLAEKGVVEQPTNEYPVGPDAEAFAEDNMARSVLLDDSSTYEYPNTIPYVGKDGTLRLGDTVNPLVGAINYAFSEYRIQPQDPGSVRFIPRNARPGEPNNKGNLVIASANVLNYFTTLDEGQDNCGPTGDKECRGAETQEQLDVQTEKLVAELLGTGADIIGLQEIENNPSDTPIETLVAALNAAEGGGDWSWIGKLDHYNEYPVRNEIIYRQDRVEPIGGPVTIADSIFDDQTGRDDPIGRPPVAQTFKFNGESFTVVNNHLKSKGCDGATGLDEDQGNGQSCFNDTRVAQAKRVLEFVNDLIAETRDPDVIVLGDMNSYLYEEPILTFETELVNLVSEWDKDPYSYSFFATYAAPWIGRGLLDYALATPSMADQVKRTEVWHINADEPRFLDWYDPDIVAPGPYRAADHDPVVVSLKIR